MSCEKSKAFNNILFLFFFFGSETSQIYTNIESLLF